MRSSGHCRGRRKLHSGRTDVASAACCLTLVSVLLFRPSDASQFLLGSTSEFGYSSLSKLLCIPQLFHFQKIIWHPLLEHFINRRGAAQRQWLLCTVEVSHNRIGDGIRVSNRESLQHPLENSQPRRGAPSLDTHPSKDQSNFRLTRQSEGLGEADTLVCTVPSWNGSRGPETKTVNIAQLRFRPLLSSHDDRHFPARPSM